MRNVMMSSYPQEPEQEASRPPEAQEARHRRASALRLLGALRRAAGWTQGFTLEQWEYSEPTRWWLYNTRNVANATDYTP